MQDNLAWEGRLASVTSACLESTCAHKALSVQLASFPLLRQSSVQVGPEAGAGALGVAPLSRDSFHRRETVTIARPPPCSGSFAG